jgi:hypothetical protein
VDGEPISIQVGKTWNRIAAYAPPDHVVGQKNSTNGVFFTRKRSSAAVPVGGTNAQQRTALLPVSLVVRRTGRTILLRLIHQNIGTFTSCWFILTRHSFDSNQITVMHHKVKEETLLALLYTKDPESFVNSTTNTYFYCYRNKQNKKSRIRKISVISN